MADKKEEKKVERTLEMRVAELENRLGIGAQEVEFTEQEVASYNKIADALGVGTGAEPAGVCRYQPPPPPPCRVYTCRIQPCRIQPSCRIQPCRIQPSCRIQPCRIQQCINECVACYVSDYEGDLSGGFGTLGY